MFHIPLGRQPSHPPMFISCSICFHMGYHMVFHASFFKLAITKKPSRGDQWAFGSSFFLFTKPERFFGYPTRRPLPPRLRLPDTVRLPHATQEAQAELPLLRFPGAPTSLSGELGTLSRMRSQSGPKLKNMDRECISQSHLQPTHLSPDLHVPFQAIQKLKKIPSITIQHPPRGVNCQPWCF